MDRSEITLTYIRALNIYVNRRLQTRGDSASDSHCVQIIGSSQRSICCWLHRRRAMSWPDTWSGARLTKAVLDVHMACRSVLLAFGLGFLYFCKPSLIFLFIRAQVHTRTNTHMHTYTHIHIHSSSMSPAKSQQRK